MNKIIFSVVVTLMSVLILCTSAFADSKPVKEPKEHKVRRVEISMTAATVRVNQERLLWAYAVPSDAIDTYIFWESSNTDIALVYDDGTVTGISPGTAIITAKTQNGKSATCTVTVPGKVLNEITPDTKNQDLPGATIENSVKLSADKLNLDVENAVRKTPKGQTAWITYENKHTVSTAALRGAVFTAEFEKGEKAKVMLKFDTTETVGNVNKKVQLQGRLTIDPTFATKDDKTIGLRVFTSSERTKLAKTKAEKHFSKNITVVCLEHNGEFGMPVEVTAKVDLSGMDKTLLKLYQHDVKTNSYILLDNQEYIIDKNGCLNFTTLHGGTIIVTN